MLTEAGAKSILQKIKSNPLHRIYVAIIRGGILTRQIDKEYNYKYHGLVIGTTTLLVEPKFIFSGGRVGHIEDVAVRRGYEKMRIGSSLVRYATDVAKKMGCVKTVLDCSDETMSFYEKPGYRYQDNCMSIKYSN